MPSYAVRISIRLSVLLFIASQALSVSAAPRGDQPAPAVSAAAAKSAPGSGFAKGTAPALAAATPVLAELLALKQSIDAQTRQITEQSKQVDSERASIAQELMQLTALEAKLGVNAYSPQPAQAAPISEVIVSNSPQRLPQSSAQIQTPQDLSNRIANLDRRVKTFGPFTLSGDIRLRDEPFFGGPSNGSLDQNRERFRLRFDVGAKLNDDFTGGFSLASGDVNDPASTNQTITGFYSRKPIAIDTAFIAYSPHQFHGLKLLAGKFAYPWYNTELTWDKDLNPEGAAETLEFNLRSASVLKKIAFVGFELPYSQVSGVSLSNKSLTGNLVYGGQLQTEWQLTHWLRLGAFTGYYDYTNADPIAFALQTSLQKNPQTPLTGLLPLAPGTTVENSMITTTATNMVTVSGAAYPTGVTKVTNAQFASKFGLFDSLARLDMTTPWERWPIRLIGDFVQNAEACANISNLQPAPANTASLQYSQSTNFACNSHQRRGYWSEIQLGQASKRGGWEFDYARIFIEREAVMSAFNYSEMYQGSNVAEHRAEIIYEAHRNVQLSYTALIGRPLNFGNSTPPVNWLERMQFDVIYTF
ncbi:MAG: putative porin [Candidatus Acidiferrales bacterium]